jgi:hypothetical protein
MSAPRTARLARWQVQLLCWSGGILWVTGAAWLLLHHFGQIQGEFGPETNPAEPWLLRLHGAAMVAALLGAGSLLVAHVWRGWSYRNQRVLGMVLTSATILMIGSGYLLYYVGDEDVRAWISIAHWTGGLAALPAFILHYRNGRRQEAR